MDFVQLIGLILFTVVITMLGYEAGYKSAIDDYIESQNAEKTIIYGDLR